MSAFELLPESLKDRFKSGWWLTELPETEEDKQLLDLGDVLRSVSNTDVLLNHIDGVLPSRILRCDLQRRVNVGVEKKVLSWRESISEPLVSIFDHIQDAGVPSGFEVFGGFVLTAANVWLPSYWLENREKSRIIDIIPSNHKYRSGQIFVGDEFDEAESTGCFPFYDGEF